MAPPGVTRRHIRQLEYCPCYIAAAGRVHLEISVLLEAAPALATQMLQRPGFYPCV